MRRSLRSLTFFIKEPGVLCVLFGFISHKKITNLAKKKEKNGAFFKRTQKNNAFRTLKNAVPNPVIMFQIVTKSLVPRHWTYICYSMLFSVL